MSIYVIVCINIYKYISVCDCVIALLRGCVLRGVRRSKNLNLLGTKPMDMTLKDFNITHLSVKLLPTPTRKHKSRHWLRSKKFRSNRKKSMIKYDTHL